MKSSTLASLTAAMKSKAHLGFAMPSCGLVSSVERRDVDDRALTKQFILTLNDPFDMFIEDNMSSDELELTLKNIALASKNDPTSVFARKILDTLKLLDEALKQTVHDVSQQILVLTEQKEYKQAYKVIEQAAEHGLFPDTKYQSKLFKSAPKQLYKTIHNWITGFAQIASPLTSEANKIHLKWVKQLVKTVPVAAYELSSKYMLAWHTHSEVLAQSKKFMLQAVKQDGWALEKASEELKRDKEVVLEAVKQEGWALQFAPEELNANKEVVLEAVKQDGTALQFASKELKADKEVVLEAVKQDGTALQFASEELKADKEVVLEAVKQKGKALQFAADKLKADKQVVATAVKQDAFALEYVSENVRQACYENRESWGLHLHLLNLVRECLSHRNV